MRAVVAAIHGILTGGTNPDWPEAFEAWLAQRDPEMHVLTHHYEAGPFPRLNWLKNQYHAAHVANALELFLDQTPLVKRAGTTGNHSSHFELPPIWFVAHSNGAVIALMATKRLIERGHEVGGVILTGSACEADLRKSGVWEWWGKGQLRVAAAYSSEDDAVVAGDASVAPWYWKLRDWIWGRLMWPYGSLGRSGWLLDGKPYKSVGRTGGGIFTRWYTGGHTSYFAPDKIRCTFEQIYQDILQKAPTRGVRCSYL